MSTVAVVVAAILGAAAVVFVARPFLRSSPGGGGKAPPVEDLERLRLVEERDRVLTALKELEFDHRTGKISDADYHELVGPLRREAADALRALDPPPSGPAAAQGAGGGDQEEPAC